MSRVHLFCIPDEKDTVTTTGRRITTGYHNPHDITRDSLLPFLSRQPHIPPPVCGYARGHRRISKGPVPGRIVSIPDPTGHTASLPGDFNRPGGSSMQARVQAEKGGEFILSHSAGRTGCTGHPPRYPCYVQTCAHKDVKNRTLLR